MPRRIAFNLLPFTKKLTGTGYYTKRLLEELQKIDHENEYELHVYNLEDARTVFGITADNFVVKNHLFLNCRIGRIFYEQFILPLKITADVLIAPSVVLPVLLPLRIKRISIIHDLIPFIFKEKYGAIQRWYVKAFTRLSAAKSDLVITISESSKRDIVQLLGIAPDKISIIYNFIPDSSDITVKKPTTGFPGDFFITVSTIQPGKNLIRLFDAFEPVAKEYNARLIVIGGKGWKYNEIFEHVVALKLEDYIVFTGYVPDDELAWYYENAKGLLYVSIYEGFGIPPLEAMTRSCPVVVSNVSSLPEVTGKAGIYVDPLNVADITAGIRKLYDAETVAEKKAYMREEAGKFNCKAEALKFLNIITRV